MPLPSTGEISLADVKSYFGKTGSVSFSDLYKDGPLVKSVKTVNVTVREPSSEYMFREYDYIYTIYKSYSSRYGEMAINWGGLDGNVYRGPAKSSIVVGDWKYVRGPLRSETSTGYHYSFHREKTSTTTESINSEVPVSGTISLKDMYSVE